MTDMATLQRLGQEFERPRAAVGGFPYPARTVAEIDRHAAMVADAVTATILSFAPTGEHGCADPPSSAPVTFDDRVHGSVDSNAAS